MTSEAIKPHYAGIAVSHSQDGSVVAVWKGGRFPRRALALVFPSDPSTVRNRTMKVGRRLRESAEVLASSSSNEPAKELVVGLDGGYVRNRHPRPERNFEVVTGKVLQARAIPPVLPSCVMEVPRQ